MTNMLNGNAHRMYTCMWMSFDYAVLSIGVRVEVPPLPPLCPHGFWGSLYGHGMVMVSCGFSS